MATTTTNFGWDIPQSTDLVKDGATAIAALGQDIDTALVDLKGGTTGQILAKASNTDLDYSWITNDVGDITAVTAGTGITGGGTSGAVTVSFDQANFGGGQNAAGKNKVLNSNFSVWQRGTSGTANSFSAGAGYNADRWQNYSVNALTVSRQATGDTTNLPFIQYCARVQRNSGQTSTSAMTMGQSIETVNSIGFAGKSVTFTFYARAGANFSSASNALTATLYSGTGTDGNILTGFTGSAAPAGGTATLTTTWQRFTFTGTVASTATQLGIYLAYTPVGTAGTNDYYEITGVQVEQANSASPYAPNGATQEAELAACQRYYWRTSAESKAYNVYSTLGVASSTTAGRFAIANPVGMRTSASAVDYANISLWDGSTYYTISSLSFNAAIGNTQISYVESAGSTLLTISRPYFLAANNSTAAYLGFSAEL